MPTLVLLEQSRLLVLLVMNSVRSLFVLLATFVITLLPDPIYIRYRLQISKRRVYANVCKSDNGPDQLVRNCCPLSSSYRSTHAASLRPTSLLNRQPIVALVLPLLYINLLLFLSNVLDPRELVSQVHLSLLSLCALFLQLRKLSS